MARTSRRLIIGSLVAMLGIALAGCATDSGSAGKDTESSKVVKIGTLRGQPHFYAPFLYDKYAPAGVTFDVVTLDTTPALNDALVAGTVDFAITGVTPTISSVAQGRDLKIVASAADGGSGFIGKPSIKSIDDLKGKNVGYLAGSAQEVALRLELKAADIDASDVKLVALPAPDMANAFANGSVDAFFGVEIGASIALQNGGHQIADPYDTAIGKVNVGLVTTGDFIKSNPKLVQKVVDTHVATIKYMSKHQDEWLTTMVNTFGGNQAIFKTALKNFWLRSDLSTEYVGQLDNLASQMKSLGMITKAPASKALVDATFVKAASK